MRRILAPRVRRIPDPTQTDTVPAWDFFPLIYAALALLPGYIRCFLPPRTSARHRPLVCVPFLSNTGEKSARQRPVAVLSVILCRDARHVDFLGDPAPWSPHGGAEQAPTPVQ